MEWPIFALLQMFLLMLSVTTALTLHIRAIKKQNQTLREHIDHLETESADQPAETDDASQSPAAWVETYLASLDDELTAKPVLKAMLENALNPDDGFYESLPSLLSEAGLAEIGGDSELKAKIVELEAALATAQAEQQDKGEEEEPAQSDELKELLQQFTKDSREMMECIQTLETENMSLREQLTEAGITPKDAQADAA